MDINSITSVVALLVAFSVALERLVEIVKGCFPIFDASEDPIKERRRKSAIQLLTALAGISTAFLAAPLLPPGVIPDNWMAKLALGLIASGGSGFWNSIQGYASQAKELKKAQAEERKIEVEEKKSVIDEQISTG